jgi:7-keto-8-aminopelargonate synthetase-like enzyme
MELSKCLTDLAFCLFDYLVLNHVADVVSAAFAHTRRVCTFAGDS